jgi:kynurenine formamidase
MTRMPRHDGFWVMVLPLRLEGGTGSPARAIAPWEA